jgi:uncharacterized protein YndB with AHSA1/START domain
MDANSVRKVVRVKAPPAVAWRVFTERMGTWWPLATHKIGKVKAADAVIEPRVRGRWYERGEDGSTCDWGRVLSWEPPSRLVLSWDIGARFDSVPAFVRPLVARAVRGRIDAPYNKGWLRGPPSRPGLARAEPPSATGSDPSPPAPSPPRGEGRSIILCIVHLFWF